MTVRLKHTIGLKRNVYKRIEADQGMYRNLYIELARIVKKLTRTAKKNYETNVASQAREFFKYIEHKGGSWWVH